MPRKCQSSQKSQKPKSINSPTENDSVSEGPNRSQQRPNKSQLTAEALEDYINKCVRYILYRAGSNLPIRKVDLQKNALQNVGRNYNNIIKEVLKKLEKVYGYTLQVYDEATSAKYIVINKLPYEKTDDEEVREIPNDIHKVLIMLVLAHIYMCNGIVGEASLFSFLNALDIDVEKKHSLFGNVKEFINVTMVKQKYLDTETDHLSRKSTYTWGQRAEKTVSKHDLLKFVCKMYKDKQPQHWTSQFEDANKQLQANEKENALIDTDTV